MRLLALACAGVLAACASPTYRAPVVERDVQREGAVESSVDPRTLPGAENAGKPGYYTVRPGDTVMRISLETGQYWRDIIEWNNIAQPDRLQVGQVLRVAPPQVASAPASAPAPAAGVPPGAAPVETVGSTAVATAPIGSSRVEARPLDARPLPSVPSAPAATTNTTTTTTAAGAPQPVDPDENLGWIWPASGPVITTFDDARNKGLGIAGKAGDPVVAAADGRVVYAGAGLRGYGNLVIVKHNNTYLTAYAHNQTLLVKEDQVVTKGQRIAEMGSTDAERVKLHFEIRRQGRPVDPLGLLPPR